MGSIEWVYSLHHYCCILYIWNEIRIVVSLPIYLIFYIKCTNLVKDGELKVKNDFGRYILKFEGGTYPRAWLGEFLGGRGGQVVYMVFSLQSSYLSSIARKPDNNPSLDSSMVYHLQVVRFIEILLQ